MKRLMIALCGALAVVLLAAVPAMGDASGCASPSACGPSYPPGQIPCVDVPCTPAPKPPAPPPAAPKKPTRAQKCANATYKKHHPKVCHVRRHHAAKHKVIVKVKVIVVNNNTVTINNSNTNSGGSAGCGSCAGTPPAPCQSCHETDQGGGDDSCRSECGDHGGDDSCHSSCRGGRDHGDKGHGDRGKHGGGDRGKGHGHKGGKCD